MNSVGIDNPLVHFLKYNRLTVGVFKLWMKMRAHQVKGYVFVATTGRSGSQSLAKVLDAVEGAVCFHEPFPTMVDDCLAKSDRKKYFQNIFRTLKAPYILRDSIGHNYYVETNHQFIKRFAQDAVKEFGTRLRVVHLKRPVLPVALSFHRIGSIPGRTERGRLWLLDPQDPENVFPIADLFVEGGPLDHDLYRCLWYCHETEGRIQRFKQQNPKVIMATLETGNLNDRDQLIIFFSNLQIPVELEKLDDVVGTRLNTKPDQRQNDMISTQAEEMHLQLCDIMEQRFGQKFLSLGTTAV